MPSSRNTPTVLAALTLVAACASGPDSPEMQPGPEPEPEPEPTSMLVAEGYSGFDGSHAFSMPLASTFSGEVRWRINAGAGALVARPVPDIAKDSEYPSWALFTPSAAGAVEVAVTGVDRSDIARITVTAYDAGDYAIGERRYHDPGAGRPSCASCHTKPDGHDHSPLNTMYWSDAQLLRAITTGAYTDDTFLAIEHRWDVTAAEARGIIVYLRALPPRGF